MHIQRAVLPTSPETSDATTSPNLALLPLLSLSVVVLILIFFAVRTFRRHLYLPSFSWLRGKGKGAKGRLGLTGVELLPTSFKAIPTPSPSPYVAAFNLGGNAGKDRSSSLLSRSSSLEALPQALSGPSPPLTSRRHSYSRPPFSLPAFLKTKDKPLHRRSRSLGVLHRNPSSSMPISAPPTPSSKTMLIDFSTSNSSTSSSTSSDLGTHKLCSASPPLIPGLPIPTASPEKVKSLPKSNAKVWTFDVEDEGDDIADSQVNDPLLAAFKRSHHQPQFKNQQESMSLIQYEQTSPQTPSLVPTRLGTANPFASLADSFSSPANRSLSPSAVAISPLSPPGIELMPITAQATNDLVDFGDDELEPSPKSQTSPTTHTVVEAKRVDFPINAPGLAVDTHETQVATKIGLVELEAPEVVSDPFDDSHALHSPVVEPTPPLDRPQDNVSAPPSPRGVSPLGNGPVTLEEHQQPDPLTASWQWDSSWSPPSAPVVPQPASGWHHEGDIKGTEADLISFDNAEPAAKDSRVRLEPVVELGIEVNKEMDPADTWFIEEPTAVWDVSWTGEDVKGGMLFGTGLKKDFDEEEGEEFSLDRARDINIIYDESLAGPSEPISIHIFEDADTTAEPTLEATLAEKDSAQATNDDIHDFYDNHDLDNDNNISRVATPLIIAASPLLSTPATPNTPLPELPAPSPIPTSPIPTNAEPSDEHNLPLLDITATIVSPPLVSPAPVKAQLPGIHPPAQTPTPPASPPPSLLGNVSSRPLWSLRAADAPPLGLPAVPSPDIALLKEDETSSVETPIHEHEDQEAIHISKEPPLGDDNFIEYEEKLVLVVDEPTDEPSAKEGKPLADPSTPQPEVASLPGSFPTSPSPVFIALPGETAPSQSHPSTESSVPKTAVVQSRVPGSTRLRAPRSAIDIALAMQLRPGLGAGADPAWMVRFLMAMFGWFAILVSGDL